MTDIRISAGKFTIYVQEGRACGWCEKAKALLNSAGHAFDLVTLPTVLLKEVAAVADMDTVPIIYVGGRLIGGFVDLKLWLETHALSVEDGQMMFRRSRAPKSDMTVVYTKRLTPSAILPTYGSTGAAGLDLAADLLLRGAPIAPAEGGVPQMVIEAGQRALVPTGISMAIPAHLYGRVAPRSGLALKSGIDTLAGVIDSDYRGEIGVMLLNTSDNPFTIRHGDRVAQLVIERVATAFLIEVDSLGGSSRGDGGFGSTGV